MDPNLLAMLLGQGQPQTTAMDLPPQYSPMADPGTQVAPQPQQDPREALMAALFAPPPEQQTEPKFRDMGTGGKIGLILSALGDIQNVRQRRSAKGARTFAPSNYTGQFLAGEHQKLQEKNQMATRADQIKRAKMAHELDRLDKADAERRQIERDAIKRAWDEAGDLKSRQRVASAAGLDGAENMNDAQLMHGMQQLAAADDAAKKAQQDRQAGFEQAHLDLSRKASARAERADAAEKSASESDKKRYDDLVGELSDLEHGIAANPQKGFAGVKDLRARLAAGEIAPDQIENQFETSLRRNAPIMDKTLLSHYKDEFEQSIQPIIDEFKNQPTAATPTAAATDAEEFRATLKGQPSPRKQAEAATRKQELATRRASPEYQQKAELRDLIIMRSAEPGKVYRLSDGRKYIAGLGISPG